MAAPLDTSVETFLELLVGASQPAWRTDERSIPNIMVNANLYKLVSFSYSYFGQMKALQAIPEPERLHIIRSAKAAILMNLVSQPRRKIKTLAEGGIALINTILEKEDDELVLLLARMIKPFLDDVNPALSFDLSTSPTLTKAVKDITERLATKDINFTPTFYRYLAPAVTDNFLKDRIARSNFRIQNTFLIDNGTDSAGNTDIPKAAEIIQYTNKSLFGPQLNFKQGEDVESMLKAREIKRKLWADQDAQKGTPASATFPPLSTTPTSATLPNISSLSATSSALPTSGANPPIKRPAPPIKRPSLTSINKGRGGAALHQTKKIMMLDESFVQEEEKAKFEEKRKHEESVAQEAARKKKEAEDKKFAAQHAKEQKERELNERKLARERAAEERRQREIDEKAKKEEERIQREESRRLREEEDRQREERRKLPTSPVGVNPDPIITAPVAPSFAAAEAVLGSDFANVSHDEVQLVQNFLCGQYDKSTTNKEIKLNEQTVTDPTSGITQVHTMFLVLDYGAAKWRKVKRKRKI
ncbi:hypothetical protein BDR26DRAFT_852273 [Obelidium mucronatum]|nr:hypothetical protein BDR26DRAFT_852273 [Obelidium mucronatum]